MAKPAGPAGLRTNLPPELQVLPEFQVLPQTLPTTLPTTLPRTLPKTLESPMRVDKTFQVGQMFRQSDLTTSPETPSETKAQMGLHILGGAFGMEPLDLPYGLPLQVKNTFVDIDVDLYEKEDRGATAASMPVMRLKPYQRPASQSAPLPEARQPVQQQPSVVPLGVPAVQVTHVAQEGEHIGVVPLDERQPEQSLGCGEHGTGRCRPCAWYWKDQGCANGRQCRHCHLCPEGELKNRKKDKIAVMRSTVPPHGP